MTDAPQSRPRRIGSARAGKKADAAEDTLGLQNPRDGSIPAPTEKWLRLTVERLFFICILGGFAAAVVGISLGGETGRMITLVSPLLATLSYPVIGLLSGFAGRPSAKERFADNCYYLGFIFTQGGLLLAFLPTTIQNERITSDEVMQFFGMAIGAALIGLIARTVLTQSGMSLTDVSDSVHHEVEMLAAKVTEQSQHVVAEFDRISAHVGNIPERFADRLDRQIDGIDDVFSRLKLSLEQAIAGVDQGRSVIRDATEKNREDHSEAMQTLVAAMHETARTMHALKAEMGERTADSARAIRTATVGLTEGIAALANLQQLGARVPEIESEVRLLAEASTNARAATQMLSSELSGAVVAVQADMMEVAREGATAIRGSVETAAEQLTEAGRDAAAKLTLRADGLRGDLERATTEYEQKAASARAEFAEVARESTALIGESSATAARQIAAAASLSAGTIGQQAKGFESELEQATAAFERVLRQFSERLDSLSGARGQNG